MMDVSQYINELYVKDHDNFYQMVSQSLTINHMPNISVSPETGKLLYLLVKIANATNALEIGALGGYSGIWICKALPDDGKLTSLELNKDYANVAKNNIEKAGYGKKVTYHIGPALETLKQFIKQKRKFDFFFIDADKENYKLYLEYSIQLAKKGALITADNVLWKGKVADKNNQENNTIFLREFNEFVAKHPRLESVIVPIGDGLTIARVL
jgi:caffeoyl-CoA O-methyltransferase